MEEWRTVICDEIVYENYEVSNFGNVRNKMTGRILKPFDNGHGYLQVDLSNSGKTQKALVHRLVAIAFIPNPNNYDTVNHKDKNRQNNHVDNLEWMSLPNNVKDGTSKKVRCIETGEIFESVKQASELTGVKADRIYSQCNRKRSKGKWTWRKNSNDLHFEYVK